MSPASAIEAQCKITARRDHLVTALSDAARVANGKPIAVLGSLLAEIEADRLTWWATDTHIWRSGVVSVTAEQPGRGLVRVDVALAFLKRCPDGDVQLSISAEQVVLKAGGFTAKMQSQPLADFPTIPQVPSGGLSLSRAALASAVGATTTIVASVAPTKYFLNGALFRVDDSAVTCVATDGHRLVKITVPHASIGQEVDTLLHREGLVELDQMLENGPDAVTYQLHDNYHVFHVGEATLLTRPLEARFPAWERIITKTHKHEFTCDRAAWLACAQRVALATVAERNAIHFEIKGGDLVLTAQSVEKGDAVDRVAATDIVGDAIGTSVSARYLVDCLAGFDCDAVTCRIVDEVTQVLFVPAKSNGSDHLHVIMPMRL